MLHRLILFVSHKCIISITYGIVITVITVTVITFLFNEDKFNALIIYMLGY